jgi:hypothetical protein
LYLKSLYLKSSKQEYYWVKNARNICNWFTKKIISDMPEDVVYTTVKKKHNSKLNMAK